MNKTENRAVIDRVAEMYERHPYPPVDEDIQAYASGEAWLLESPNPNFHLYWPHDDVTQDLDILIAGCGTQQAAQIAASMPQARIVGTDISDNSLAETKRLSDQIDAQNITLNKCAIEEITTLKQDFDLVICTGVLHHLENPDVGLAALKTVLRPNGAMHLMLYGQHGRTGVYMLQALFQTMQIDPLKVTHSDIHKICDLVENNPASHPFHGVRHLHPDWQDDEGLVDFLLHLQDRAYSLDEVDEFLTSADLKLQMLLFAGRTDPMFTPLENISPATFKKLPDIQQRSAVELYRASVKKHTFIACHASKDRSRYEIDLSLKAWDTTIPILSYGLAVERPNTDRKTFRITWPVHGEPDIHVETTEAGMKFLETFDGKRTLSAAYAFAGFKKSDMALKRQLASFVERCARADFITFRSLTSSG